MATGLPISLQGLSAPHPPSHSNSGNNILGDSSTSPTYVQSINTSGFNHSSSTGGGPLTSLHATPKHKRVGSITSVHSRASSGQVGAFDQDDYALSGSENDQLTPRSSNINSSGATILHPAGGGKDEKFQSSIRVVIRKRPKRPKESEENDVCHVTDNVNIAVYEPKFKVDMTKVVEPVLFHFDHVFDETQGNKVVYNEIGKPLLETVFRGNNAIAFAFGQTGSGKTHTMFGSPDGKEQGIYSMASKELLDTLKSSGDEMKLVVSFYEIYAAKLYDLLNDRAKIKTLEDEYKNLNLVGLSEHNVTSFTTLMEMIKLGNLNRASGTTHANDRSSRSHAVLVLNVKKLSAPNAIGHTEHKQFSKLTFVDLAGSERAADTTGMDKKTRMEGAEINKSLLALKECIRSLDLRKKHIPFRGSKLTQVLRDSFIGQSTTLMISNISPCQSHCEDTLNTLRYANRIKELKTQDGQGGQQFAPIPCANCGLPIFSNSKEQHVCPRQMVKCPHCRKQVEKSKLDEHVKECSEAAINCPHCGVRCVQSTLKKHLKKCGKAPALCKLCGDKVLRDGMKQHLDSQCQQSKIPCNYCRALVARCDMELHVESCNAAPVNCPDCHMVVRRGKMNEHKNTCVAGKRNIAEKNNNHNRGGQHFGGPSAQNSPAQPGLPSLPGRQLNGGKPAGHQRRKSATDGELMAHLDIDGGGHHHHPAWGKSPSGPVGGGGRRSRATTPDDITSPNKGRPGQQGLWKAHSDLPIQKGGGDTQGCKHCGKNILLGNKEKHLQNDCPGYPIECSFADFGCKVKIARGKMPAHLRDNIMVHMDMMRHHTTQLQKENVELRLALAKAEHEKEINESRAASRDGKRQKAGSESPADQPMTEEERLEELRLQESFFSSPLEFAPPPEEKREMSELLRTPGGRVSPGRAKSGSQPQGSPSAPSSSKGASGRRASEQRLLGGHTSPSADPWSPIPGLNDARRGRNTTTDASAPSPPPAAVGRLAPGRGAPVSSPPPPVQKSTTAAHISPPRSPNATNGWVMPTQGRNP